MRSLSRHLFIITGENETFSLFLLTRSSPDPIRDSNVDVDVDAEDEEEEELVRAEERKKKKTPERSASF